MIFKTNNLNTLLPSLWRRSWGWGFLLLVFLALPLTSAAAKKKAHEPNDRQYWCSLAYRMAQPVLENMAKGELQKNMQTEFSPSFDNRNRKVLYMECFDRLMASMQPLALMAWYQTLPKDLSNGQVRAALTKVLHRMFDHQQNFNEGGYLTIGFCGHQPNVADWYTNNGSLYMTTLAFMPLGLPATHPFWTDAVQPWTQVKAWNGEAFPKDHHWGDYITTKDKW